MKYIILFFILFFWIYTNTYALPFAIVTPFIFEVGILLYAIIGVVWAYVVQFFILKKNIILYFIFLFSISSIILFFYLVNFLPPSQLFFNIFWYNVSYLWFLLFAWFFLFFGILEKYFRKTVFLWCIWALCIFVINIPLLTDTIKLKVTFSQVINSFEAYISQDLEPISWYRLNHIYVAQDYKYFFEGWEKRCRVTLSYYEHGSDMWAFAIASEKWKDISIYTWLDKNDLCKKLIFKALYDIQ